jgi:hypothetical protein
MAQMACCVGDILAIRMLRRTPMSEMTPTIGLNQAPRTTDAAHGQRDTAGPRARGQRGPGGRTAWVTGNWRWPTREPSGSRVSSLASRRQSHRYPGRARRPYRTTPSRACPGGSGHAAIGGLVRTLLARLLLAASGPADPVPAIPTSRLAQLAGLIPNIPHLRRFRARGTGNS